MCGVHFSFKSLSAGLMSPLGSGSTAQESLEGQNCSFLPVFSNHLLRCFWQWSDRSDLLPDLSNSQCGLPWWAIKTSFIAYWSLSFQFSSVIQFCLTLCNRKDCSTPGFPVHHQLLELTKTHVHWGSDAIQPSHPLSLPCLPAFNLSQHQSVFQSVFSSSHQVAKLLEFQL